MDDGLLASVRDGVLDLDRLLGMARELAGTEDGQEALYDGLRDRVSTLIRSEGSTPAEAEETREALRRLAGLAWGLSGSDEPAALHKLAVRLEVLADQLGDVLAFADAYAIQALRRLPHFQACILELARCNGKTARRDLLDTLGLKEANGTRVLKVLEKARLIVRRKRGQSVDVELTDLGRRTAAEWSPRGGSGSRLALSEPVQGMSRSEFSVEANPLRQ
jgi:DNA-binding MarR family transcriptional regulator